MNIDELNAAIDANKYTMVIPTNFYPSMGVLIDINDNCKDLKAGDMYVGNRNMGWKLGVVYKVNRNGGYIMCDMDSPFGMIYSYNINECYKVIGIVNLPDSHHAITHDIKGIII